MIILNIFVFFTSQIFFTFVFNGRFFYCSSPSLHKQNRSSEDEWRSLEFNFRFFCSLHHRLIKSMFAPWSSLPSIWQKLVWYSNWGVNCVRLKTILTSSISSGLDINKKIWYSFNLHEAIYTTEKWLKSVISKVWLFAKVKLGNFSCKTAIATNFFRSLDKISIWTSFLHIKHSNWLKALLLKHKFIKHKITAILNLKQSANTTKHSTLHL